MRIINQYIGQTVFFAVSTVLLIIVGLDAVFAFIGELDYLKNNYQVMQALMYVVITLPRRIYEFIPVSTLIGCLIGLGALASTSELTVMRAAGISVARIVFAACLPVLIAVTLGLVLGQYVVPNTEQYAESERSIQTDGGEAFQARHGFWYRDEHFFIHVKAIQPNGVMFGVARFQMRDGQNLELADYSDRAIFQGDHWVLLNVEQSQIGETSVKEASLDTLHWETSLTPEILSIVVLKPEYLSITGLMEYSKYLADQGLDVTAYSFAFWKKVLQPVATIVMVFIAISFIFGPLRSVTMGQRITAGIVTGLTFNYAQDLLGHVSIVFKVDPLIAASIPILVCLFAGIYLLRRV